ncbi:MAG: helix-turn-helix transcriptional regulator, partial [Solirubrobacteraceae bacterium]|nr:helix-turn-helix transcriptional regulator [Solirubrobacteraceae bacterium]
DVAARLHTSERTLQRQLADEHTSFSVIREQVASALALRWIREGGQSASEIAYRLGYHSPSTFARAFRRWHGV